MASGQLKNTPAALPPDSERVRLWFARLGLQYYAAGRQASLQGVSPVDANLLHHAVEMLMKAALARVLSLQEMKKLGHELPALWDRVKQLHPDPRIATLDVAVNRLEPHEELRYPDSLLSAGGVIRLSRLRADWTPHPPQPTPTGPTYDLVLEDVDELMKVLLDATGLNPQFLANEFFNPEARHALVDQNLHPIFLAPSVDNPALRWWRKQHLPFVIGVAVGAVLALVVMGLV